MRVKGSFFLLIASFLLCIPSHAEDFEDRGSLRHVVVPTLDMVDTPTAVTLPRGAYVVSFWAYNNGGLLTKAQLGLHDNIYLGASFDVENVIGENEMRMNIPGVIARVKFTDGWKRFPILVAMGYDSFYAGMTGKVQEAVSGNPFNRMIYGPYFAVTKPIYLLGEEQHIHFGVRTPVQPDYVPRDTSFYISIDFPIGMFVPIFEIERVYFDYRRLQEILYNFGFRFNFIENLAIEVDLLTGAGMRANRMVVLEYMNRF